MSSEHVQLSKAAVAVTDEQSIASLTNHFTGQRAKVNTLDKRMEEFIEQEMAKRKAQLAESGTSTDAQDPKESEKALVEDAEVVEKEEDEEEEKEEEKLFEVKTHEPAEGASQKGSHAQGSLSSNAPRIGNVIDLSNMNLRATSSTASATAASDHQPKRWHKNEGPSTTAGILEVDLPVEEQLRMYEKTRQAALEALKAQRKKRPHGQRDEFDEFEVYGDAKSQPLIAGNVSSDFSRRTSQKNT